jgi:hypothetical protein
MKELAYELQQAGEALQQSMHSCLDAARNLYGMAGGTPEERQERKNLIDRIRGHVGKYVIILQTDNPELRGRQFLLEEIRGIRAILKDGDRRVDVLLDQLIPVQAV